ncbi:MAG: archaeosortase/exosortase family protein [Nanoarchaeota archaeon]|nr:archaeosortase/exosortase family protein [Nanoarchaeota archaeon]
MDSILFFIAFFSALFVLDHNKIKRKSYIIFFIIGFIGMLFINVLRLLLLILVGLHISEELAGGIFHTNAACIISSFIISSYRSIFIRIGTRLFEIGG